MRAVLRVCGFYPGICLTTEEKSWKNLSQGSHTKLKTKLIYMALVRERTTPTERPPLVGEVSTKLLRIEGFRVV
jgi:hypothetical protein